MLAVKAMGAMVGKTAAFDVKAAVRADKVFNLFLEFFHQRNYNIKRDEQRESLRKFVQRFPLSCILCYDGIKKIRHGFNFP